MRKDISKLPTSALTNLTAYQMWVMKMINARVKRRDNKVWLYYDKPNLLRAFKRGNKLR